MTREKGPIYVAEKEIDNIKKHQLEVAKKAKQHRNFEPQPVWVFFDEINTNDSVGLFREMVCDHTMNGRKLPSNIKIVAALNPYRKRKKLHTTVGITHKNTANEGPKDKGGIAFRDLVYVVHPIPRTMLEYIWDYGTLHQSEERSQVLHGEGLPTPRLSHNDHRHTRIKPKVHGQHLHHVVDREHEALEPLPSFLDGR